MLLGLVVGATMSRGSPVKGIAMTVIGMRLGRVGTDITTGIERFDFGTPELADGIEITSIAMGVFGIADFLRNVNRMKHISILPPVRLRDMLPSKAELKESAMPMLRGTLVGTLFGCMPGTGPTITTFIAYALEQKVSRTPERFGTGMLAGVAAPEAAAHSKTQVDFIPTMSLGIPAARAWPCFLARFLFTVFHQGRGSSPGIPTSSWGWTRAFGSAILFL